MIRLGLCCIFVKENITFRRTTVTYISKLTKEKQLSYLSNIILHNTNALCKAVTFCNTNGIKAFRINSKFFPVKTHPDVGYELKQLPEHQAIIKNLEEVKAFCTKNNIRLSFHPDQFVLLPSPNKAITQNSIKELIYHAELAEIINADVINIHGGGVYNDKKESLNRLIKTIEALPNIIKKKLTIENDDKSYTPSDLLPICEKTNIPLVYDIHHHRYKPDKLSIEQATNKAIATWNREPLFHISSPIHGWNKKDSFKHHDYINLEDFPDIWLNKTITVDVEAKAKELAVIKLKNDLLEVKKGIILQ